MDPEACPFSIMAWCSEIPGPCVMQWKPCPINISVRRNYNCFRNALDQDARSKSIMCSGYGWTNFLKQHMLLTSQKGESQREDTLWFKKPIIKGWVNSLFVTWRFPRTRGPSAWILHACSSCNIPWLGWRGDTLLEGKEGFKSRRIEWETSMLRPFSWKLCHLQSPTFLRRQWGPIKHRHHLCLPFRVFLIVSMPVLGFFLDDLEIVRVEPALHTEKMKHPTHKIER